MGQRDRVLWVVAVEKEWKAVCAGLGLSGTVGEEWVVARYGHHDLLLSGVGKANAAGAVGRWLDPEVHGCVVSAGVAGVLGPAEGRDGLEVGSVVLGRESVYGDEGVETAQGLIEIGDLGFAPGPGGASRYAGYSGVVDAWAGDGGSVGVIATVSSGAGTDALRDRRSAFAVAEAMEGAAVLQVAARLGVPGLELRGISNTTGERVDQVWDLASGLEALEEGVARLDGLIRRCGVCG